MSLYPQCLGTDVLQIADFFQSMGHKSKHEIQLCFIYTFYTHNLKVILCTISSLPVLSLWPTVWGSGMELSTCSVMSVLSKFWILEHFEFGVWVMNAWPVYPYE
jgi:hypothetical protein